MSCFYPKLAVNYGLNPETGKNKIKFVPERVDYNINLLRSRYGDNLLILPCGHCLGCLFDKAKDWAVRAQCESLYHSSSCFLTLTYDDEHLGDNVLDRSDIKQFIKDLRNRGLKFRYFGCGEYGSTSHRKHFHLILFGYYPSDAVLYARPTKDPLYVSEFLNSVWQKGYVVVGQCTYESAGYVARYTTKKLGDDDSFIFMSTRPGLGYQYCIDHAESILKTGKVVGQFGVHDSASIPRYFDKILCSFFPVEYADLVYRRIQSIQLLDRSSMIHCKLGHLEQLKSAQAAVLEDKLNRIERL